MHFVNGDKPNAGWYCILSIWLVLRFNVACV